MKRVILPVLAAVAAFGFVSPAMSTLTTFATYNVETLSSTYSSQNFKFTGDGTANSLPTLTAITLNADGTTASATRAIVKFSYAVDGLSGSTIDAYMNFNNLKSMTPQAASSTSIDLDDFSGSVTFTPVSAGVIGGHVYTTNTNLLSVFLQDAEFQRKRTTRALSDGTGTIVDGNYDPTLVNFTSDLLTFDDTYGTQRQASLSYTGDVNSSPSMFTGSSNGTFASNPEPVAGAVPETATWALMLVGFGAIGGALRSGRGRKDGLLVG